jgi:hypothetical protein
LCPLHQIIVISLPFVIERIVESFGFFSVLFELFGGVEMGRKRGSFCGGIRRDGMGRKGDREASRSRGRR